MNTTFGHDFDPAQRASDADERSVREALRVTTLFIAVVLLMLWAGLADAGLITDSSVPAAGPDATSSSPTLR